MDRKKGNDGDDDKGNRSTKTSSKSDGRSQKQSHSSLKDAPAAAPTASASASVATDATSRSPLPPTTTTNQTTTPTRTTSQRQHPQPPGHTSQQQQQQQQHGASNEGEREEEEDWRTVLEENVGKPGREALHSFFYPPVRHSMAEEQQLGTTVAGGGGGANNNSDAMNRSLGGSERSTGTGTGYASSPHRRKRRPMQSDGQENPSSAVASSSVGATSTTPSGGGLSTAPRTATQKGQDPLQQPASPSTGGASGTTSTPEQFQDEGGETLPPPQQQNSQHNQNTTTQVFDEHFYQQAVEDRRFVEHIWTIYDDIIILSLFTQVGIVARLGVSTWFTYIDNVFSNDSPLFVNLPLNCLSCFLMGLLCSGERLLEIITTRFSPPQLQQQIHYESLQDSDPDDHDDGSEEEELGHRRKAKSSRKGRLRLSMHDGGNSADEDDSRQGLGNGYSAASHSSDDDDDGLYATSPESAAAGRGGLFSRNARRRIKKHRGRRRRRRKRDKLSGGIDGADGATNDGWFHSWQPPVHLNEELRDVQLLALERRIRLSKCLVLFPVKKADVDVMEHYFHQGYKKEHEEMNASNHEDDEFNDYGVHHHGGGHDTGGLDDLVLEESIDAESSAMVAPNTKRKSTPPKSVGKSGPAAAATTTTTTPANPSTTTSGSPANSKMEAGSKPAVDPLTGTLPSQDDAVDDHDNGNNERVNNMSIVDLNDTSPVENGEQPANNTTLYGDEPAQDLNQMVQDVQANVTENISRLRRVNIADGWDVGTTPEAMSDDLMLGLRDGFCGALSSFSSWNSAMVNLLRGGNIGSALVGYVLGIQLPIIAYRFGQHVAVYIFIWRCRRETKRDERRGYGIRVSMNEFSEDRNNEMYRSGSIHGSLEMVDTNGSGDMVPDADGHSSNQTSPQHSMGGAAGAGGAYELPTETNHVERETPSIRAVATALFIIALVTQCTSISFYTDYESQVVALSLLFSPLGVLARWRLSKYNSWRQTFPIGTFTANMLACALSGGLGHLLAGNPDERERLVLVSFINGFGGTLSSVAAFIVEILAGVDPVLLRLDGIIYGLLSIFWAMVVGFVFSASADWADATE